MPKPNSLRDYNGEDLKEGDSILLREYVPGIGEYIETRGVVTLEDDGYYLNERKLALLDIFYITEHGEDSAI